MEGSTTDWREAAATNRARIVALEHELARVRDRQHELAESVAVVRFLAEEIAELGADLKTLTTQVTMLARRAVERPSAPTVGQYLGLAVAVAALVVAALH